MLELCFESTSIGFPPDKFNFFVRRSSVTPLKLPADGGVCSLCIKWNWLEIAPEVNFKLKKFQFEKFIDMGISLCIYICLHVRGCANICILKLSWLHWINHKRNLCCLDTDIVQMEGTEGQCSSADASPIKTFRWR